MKQTTIQEKQCCAKMPSINIFIMKTMDGFMIIISVTKTLSTQQTIAGITPFFFDIPSSEKIVKAADVIREKFLQQVV